MAIKKIMCCCGSGLGSSMLVRMNETAADLFVVGGDLAAFVEHLPHKIILDNIMDMNELEGKLKEWV